MQIFYYLKYFNQIFLKEKCIYDKDILILIKDSLGIVVLVVIDIHLLGEEKIEDKGLFVGTRLEH